MNYIRLVGYEGVQTLSDGSQVQGVSRTLKTEGFSWDSVVFQQGRPILDSELNLTQGIFAEKFNKFASIITRDGWITTPIGADSNNPTRARFNAFKYLFMGRELTFDDGNGRVEVDMGAIIQQANRLDSIYAVVHFEEVAAPGENTSFRETIKLHGNLNGANISNDLIDPALPTQDPTTRRVQLSYRVISAMGNNFGAIPAVNTDGQMIAEYSFSTYYDNDNRYYRAGDGTIASATRLGTTDGYVYLIPLFGVGRTNNDTGINGSRLTPIIRKASMAFVSGIASEITHTDIPGLGTNNVQDALARLVELVGQVRAGGEQDISDFADAVLTCCNQIKVGVDNVNAALEDLLIEVGGTPTGSTGSGTGTGGSGTPNSPDVEGGM